MVTDCWRPGRGLRPELTTESRPTRITHRAADIRADAAVVREADRGDELVRTVRVRDQFLSDPAPVQVEIAPAPR